MWFFENRADNQETWAFVESLFTPEECKQIIELGELLIPDTATTTNGMCLDVRDSKVSWIYPSEKSEFIFRKMTDLGIHVNKQFFNFDLDGFAEGFQFTRYDAPGGKYDLHLDKTYKQNIRKLSIVVQLSNPDDYDGGELKIQTASEPATMKRQQGFAVAFPSFVLHGVTPVTRGTRYSLVAWITGPQFK